METRERCGRCGAEADGSYQMALIGWRRVRLGALRGMDLCALERVLCPECGDRVLDVVGEIGFWNSEYI
jgi:DNA-directed RNA polymerase subunit RPC12/RpoP